MLLSYYLNQILTTRYACKFREVLWCPQTKNVVVGRQVSQSHMKVYAADCTTPVRGKEKTGNNINSKKTLCTSQLQ